MVLPQGRSCPTWLRRANDMKKLTPLRAIAFWPIRILPASGFPAGGGREAAEVLPIPARPEREPVSCGAAEVVAEAAAVFERRAVESVVRQPDAVRPSGPAGRRCTSDCAEPSAILRVRDRQSGGGSRGFCRRRFASFPARWRGRPGRGGRRGV